MPLVQEESTADGFLEEFQELPFGIRLRGTYDSLLEGDLENADSATFSYVRPDGGDEIWGAVGAIGRPFNLTEESQIELPLLWNIDELTFLPGVSFNRVTGTGGGLNEVDSLDFRVGMVFALQPKPAPDRTTLFDAHVLTASYRLDGTFDFDDFRSAGEFTWEPILEEPLSIGGSYLNFFVPQLKYRSRLFLRGEGGEGTSGSEDFFRLGPVFELHLRPNVPGLRRLEFFGRYTYRWELANDLEDTNYLEAGALWQLDEKGHLALELSYQRGEVPVKLTEVDYFRLALALRF